MKRIDPTTMTTIPVFIEDTHCEDLARQSFAHFRNTASRLGFGNLTLEFYTDKERFETARKKCDLGVVAVEEWDYLNSFMGEKPVITQWKSSQMQTMYWTVGPKGDSGSVSTVAKDLVTYLQDCKWNGNILYFRGEEDAKLPPVAGAKIYHTDITPNSTTQREIAFFDALNAKCPVSQSPYSCLSCDLILEGNPSCSLTRKWSATLDRDCHTYQNYQLNLHIARPTTAGFEKAFTTLFCQTGILPQWWSKN